ncbi:uncharacterized protein LOC111058271 [Nilaparvata lugens]|uniref:uncharacterized protein LOC111058271 n=1 Tax=Nilaparvata lugens TaxID=108931 RepID=UPI00193E9182|nr:uncharacterized protein LOC111058271 [Nilaparvata lugens]
MLGNCLLQVTTVLFIVFLVNVSETNSLKGKNGKCIQANPCKCTFPDGMYYDFSNIMEFQLSWLKLNETTDLKYSPCRDSKLVENPTEVNDCNTGSGVTLCLRSNSTTPKKYTGLNLSTSEFVSTNENDPVSVKFQKMDGKSPVITMKLVCDKSAILPDLKVSPESKTNNNAFDLLLTSVDACLKAGDTLVDEDEMSTGSKLIIIFLVLFAAYFGGGVLALKYIRGAEGFEMIPNYEFWSDLPSLVRDGVLFLVSGFQVTPSYDRI